jgi:hypothetical protein
MRAGISIPKVNAATNTASLPDVTSNRRMTDPLRFPNSEILSRIGERCSKGNNRFILEWFQPEPPGSRKCTRMPIVLEVAVRQARLRK